MTENPFWLFRRDREGNPGWFDGEQSFILPKNTPELAEIRRLIHQASNKFPLHLSNGVFTMKTWQAEGFARPGK